MPIIKRPTVEKNVAIMLFFAVSVVVLPIAHRDTQFAVIALLGPQAGHNSYIGPMSTILLEKSLQLEKNVCIGNTACRPSRKS